jgi:WD40 repeat protein
MQAIQAFLRFDEPETAVSLFSAWRQKSEHALVIVDQFEELFTLNRPDVQEAFAALLGRLVLEADVHVLLSLRDDFLFHCQKHESLSPVFSELTPLGALSPSALRRALVQPALACGYRFEEEALVEEMVSEVGQERGVLPLLAFAASRLWDKRDREKGLLTREAYQEIGGVGGALARHAEETLSRIGEERTPLVRELFRNLVTAQGTRASREVEELLSIFPKEDERRAAEEVLRELVAARLLTSYEDSVEIIHESLLSAWPRLVQWRNQDEGGALLRDQLRQAAQVWQDRGRREDLLWTGSSYREFALWRERYSGGLSATEEAFAESAKKLAERKRRRRRLAVAGVIGAALVVATGTGVLWRRSEAARAQAVAAARHAEAQQLFALGQVELERHPTSAVAHALVSLELADTTHARLLALRALWRGPTAFALAATDKEGPGPILDFSPDGRWLANVEQTSGTVRLWGRDGSGPRVLTGAGVRPQLGFSADSRFLVVTYPEKARIYSLPQAELVRQIDESFLSGEVVGQDLVTWHALEPQAGGRSRRLVKSWRLSDGEPETLGVWSGGADFWIDPIERRAYSQLEGDIYEAPLREMAAAPRRAVRVGEPSHQWHVSLDGERIYTWSESGAGRIWSRATGARLTGPRIDRPEEVPAWWQVKSSRDGRWLAGAASEAGAVYLWDLAGPVAAEARLLRRDARMLAAALDPSGSWLATRDNRAVTLWPLARSHPHVLRAPHTGLWALAVDPGGRWVAAGGQVSPEAWLWPLTPGAATERVTLDVGVGAISLAVSPRGDRVAAGGQGVRLVSLLGGPPETLPGFENGVLALDFDPQGRRLAAGGIGFPNTKERLVRVYDLETRRSQVLDAGDAKAIYSVEFWPDGRVLAAGGGGVRLWDVAAARSTLVLEGVIVAHGSPDGRKLLGIRARPGPGGAVGTAVVYDLERKEATPLETHGNRVTCVAWIASGRVVTGSLDGFVRVGPSTGEEPHLLLGHEAGVRDVRAGPDDTWIASAGEDGTVRLWPVPADGPPLHTLSIGEFLERLRSLTNFRVVRDDEAAGGYRLDFEPFTGWNRPPPSW